MLYLPIKVAESIQDFDEFPAKSDLKRPRKSTFGVSERTITWKESPRMEGDAASIVEAPVKKK